MKEKIESGVPDTNKIEDIEAEVNITPEHKAVMIRHLIGRWNQRTEINIEKKLSALKPGKDLEKEIGRLEENIDAMRANWGLETVPKNVCDSIEAIEKQLGTGKAAKLKEVFINNREKIIVALKELAGEKSDSKNEKTEPLDDVKKYKGIWSRSRQTKIGKLANKNSVSALENSLRDYESYLSDAEGDFSAISISPDLKAKVKDFESDNKTKAYAVDLKTAYGDYLKDVILDIKTRIKEVEANTPDSSNEVLASLDTETREAVDKMKATWEKLDNNAIGKLDDKDEDDLNKTIGKLISRIKGLETDWKNKAPKSYKNFIKDYRISKEVEEQIKADYINSKKRVLQEAEAIDWGEEEADADIEVIDDVDAEGSTNSSQAGINDLLKATLAEEGLGDAKSVFEYPDSIIDKLDPSLKENRDVLLKLAKKSRAERVKWVEQKTLLLSSVENNDASLEDTRELMIAKLKRLNNDFEANIPDGLLMVIKDYEKIESGEEDIKIIKESYIKNFEDIVAQLGAISKTNEEVEDVEEDDGIDFEGSGGIAEDWMDDLYEKDDVVEEEAYEEPVIDFAGSGGIAEDWMNDTVELKNDEEPIEENEVFEADIENETSVEQSEKEIDQDVLDRFQNELGISQEDLAEIEGFADLDKGQQLMSCENLQQLLAARVVEEGHQRQTEASQNGKILGLKFLNKAWQTMSKNFQVAKHESEAAKDFKAGGIDLHKETLQELTNSYHDYGPDISYENGELRLNFSSELKS